MAALLSERLGFLLVVVVAGLGTALITGNEVVAVVVAIMGGLAFLAGREKRTVWGASQAGEATKRNGGPFTYLFAWELSGKPDLERVTMALAKGGLEVNKPSSSNAKLVFRGGSQVYTRLFGGYFVAPRHLPIKAKLSTVNVESTRVELELEVQDTLTVAIRDGALEERYRKAAADIRTAVEKGLKEQNPSPVHGAKLGRSRGQS